MTNDTAVFDAMRFDFEAGKDIWTGLTGTREAIKRDRYGIDPTSLNYCPHEWLDERGYVARERAKNATYKFGKSPPAGLC
jgi:hypothetical protein